jgi:hypothetical protein
MKRALNLTLRAKAKAVPIHAMEALGGEEYSSYSYFNSALDGGEWSASRPDRASPPQGKDPRCPPDRRLGGPRAGLDTEAREKILLSLPGLN